jgi:7-cyano-7-deazaguanine synthase in queuosine biosynthesis
MFECVIGADTTNPTVELPGLAPVRVPVEEQDKWQNYKLPFLHLDKSHTVQLAHDLGLDWLPKMTHTCTESPDIRCGQCWQCNERAWAFNLLGLEDTGTF